MHTYLKRLTDEREGLTITATELAERAASEDRDLTDSERTAIRGWQDRCADIDAQLTEYGSTLDSVRSYAQLRERLDAQAATEPAAPTGRLEQRGPLSFGTQFVESAEFRAYNGHGQSQPVTLEGFLETRAVITTSSLAIPSFILPPVEQQFMSKLLNVCGRVTVSSGVVEWIVVGADPVAAVVAEGAAKPEATVTFTPASSTLDTLAHWVQVTRQALEDASYIRTLLEGKLRRGLLAKAEADMLTAIGAATTGTATGTDLLGSIRAGVGTVEAAGYNPNAVLLNPADYAELDIAVMGGTLNGPVIGATFWGLTPIALSGVSAGTAFVGDFQSGCTLFDRGVTSVFVTDSHASLFISNILVILAEARVKSVVDEPLAIAECTVTP